MKNEHDLAYDRQCREDIAKETATYLSIQYDSVLQYLEANDPAQAEALKTDNKTLNFKELKKKNYRNFTDDQLTEFLNTAEKYSKDFRAVKMAIFENTHSSEK